VGRARSPSTPTPLIAGHVSANAPGRTEGSREHTDLAVTRRRDDRHGLLRHTIHAPRSEADATIAAAVFATRSTPTSIVGRRDGRDELCRVPTRTTGTTRRASPLGPAGRCAWSMRRNTSTRCSRRGSGVTTREWRDPSAHSRTSREHPCWRDANAYSRTSSDRATKKAMRAAARRERARSPSTSTPRVVDHVSANAPGRTEGSREHTNLVVRADATTARAVFPHDHAHLDRGQTRRPQQPSSPHDPRAPRSWADATTATAVFATRSTRTSIVGRRDDRDELCCVAARTTGITRRASPLGPAGHLARSMRGVTQRRATRRMQTRHHTSTTIECSEHATWKAMRAAARRERARSPSTSSPRVVDHVSANAPGRTEGSREHTNLVVTRRRDDRHGRLPTRPRAPRSWADATTATAVFATRSTRTSIVGRRDDRNSRLRHTIHAHLDRRQTRRP
jgi:hypothetical protein